MSKFLTYRDLYNRSNKELEKVIADERKTIEDFDKERQKVNEKERENLELQNTVSQLAADKQTLEVKGEALASAAKFHQKQNKRVGAIYPWK